MPKFKKQFWSLYLDIWIYLVFGALNLWFWICGAGEQNRTAIYGFSDRRRHQVGYPGVMNHLLAHCLVGNVWIATLWVVPRRGKPTAYSACPPSLSPLLFSPPPNFVPRKAGRAAQNWRLVKFIKNTHILITSLADIIVFVNLFAWQTFILFDILTEW